MLQQNRTLEFPRQTVGVIYVKTPFFFHWPIADAFGRVDIPANRNIRISVDDRASKDISFLAGMGPDVFDAMEFPYAEFDAAGFAHLQEMHSLGELNLVWSNVNNDWLEHLVTMQSLRKLSLMHTPITDEALDSVAKLNGLESLDVRYTKVSNAGLQKLAPLTNLKYLRAGYTEVEDSAVQEMSQVLPNCYCDLSW